MQNFSSHPVTLIKRDKVTSQWVVKTSFKCKVFLYIKTRRQVLGTKKIEIERKKQREISKEIQIEKCIEILLNID